MTRYRLGLLLALALACGDDGNTNTNRSVGAAATGSLYVLGNEIYGADDSTSYLNALTSLDLKPLDRTRAVEFGGGRASFASVDGKLFVAPPESTTIERYDLAPDGTPKKTGELSVANLGFTTAMVDEWSVSFISSTKAYLFNADDGTIAIWNPSTMQIIGEIAPPDWVRPGNTLDGGAPIVVGDRLLKTVYWTVGDTSVASDEQYLAVYDTQTDKLLDLVPEQRCPGLGNRVSQDRAGNLYFSSWIWGVTDALLHGTKPSCALRVKKGELRFDADWILRYPEVTEGRHGGLLNVLGDGSAVFSAFHQERVTLDASTTPDDLAASDNWRLWRVDLETKKAAPLVGIEWNSGAASAFVIDGRTFEFVPNGDWSNTQVFEVRDGVGTKVIDVQGWSYQFLKVR